ncbi:hypothetical protein [Burkholderia glumae]|uniref:hypothetical protein n=1 Tax=Burkholderia glumae TaxID=337 RepID=UPI00214A7A07|nr:hypothetical protein [Burkholderia glumae]MCR1769328.1 hypothetical protein [Burkholderia glumae]
MTNEPTIRYELLTSAGLRTVAGDGHPEKCVVTHLISGIRIGHGATRTAALANATSNLERNRKRLRTMLDQAITSRYELQHAVQRLQQNHHDILGGAAA